MIARKTYPRGLIFDLDGVITDTARYHLQAWKKIGQKIGIRLPAEANKYLKGRSRTDSLTYILSLLPSNRTFLNVKKQQLADQKNVIYQQLISRITEKDILPGIRSLLEDARNNGLLIALASASENAPKILTQLKLNCYFDAVVDPTKLRNGKPNPEIFICAAKLLKLKNSEVISFEDASSGIEAIKRAGQYAVGVGKSSDLLEADIVVGTTAELNFEKLQQDFQQHTKY